MKQANTRTALSEPAATGAFRDRRRETTPMNAGASRAFEAPVPAQLRCFVAQADNVACLLDRISSISQPNAEAGNEELRALLNTPGFLALLTSEKQPQIQIVGNFFSYGFREIYHA